MYISVDHPPDISTNISLWCNYVFRYIPEKKSTQNTRGKDSRKINSV